MPPLYGYKIVILQDTNSDRLLRGYSTCFIMTCFKNNKLNNDKNKVSSVLEK